MEVNRYAKGTDLDGSIFFLMLPSGCGYLVVAGAGAAGGYIMRDKGYKVKKPIEKSDKEKADKEKR